VVRDFFHQQYYKLAIFIKDLFEFLLIFQSKYIYFLLVLGMTSVVVPDFSLWVNEILANFFFKLKCWEQKQKYTRKIHDFFPMLAIIWMA